MRRACAVASVALALCFVTTTAEAAPITPVKVLDPPGVQLQPFRNDTWILFTSNAPSSPKHFDVFAAGPSGSPRRRLNEQGTQGASGGFVPGTNKAIFQQYAGPTSDIYFYNLTTRTRTKVPRVNSAAWDWDPRVSTTYISFFRNYKAHGKKRVGVYLLTRSAGPPRRIASYPGSAFLTNGSVGDHYATWTVCNANTCFAAVYNADTKRLRKIPSVNNRPQYAPVVDETNGFVYFVRSGFGCGLQVTFYSVPVANLATTPVKLAVLRKGFDTDDEMSLWLNPGSGDLDLQFIRVNCKASTGVWAIPSVGPG